MAEWTLGLLASLKLLLLIVFATCYWIGGRGPKWVRRYVGGTVFAFGLCVFALVEGGFEWTMMLVLATYPLALSVGYGGDALGEKLLRRAVYGVGLGCAALPLVVVSGLWVLWGLQLALAICASVLLGVLNPFRSAVAEETLIASLSCGLAPFLT